MNSTRWRQTEKPSASAVILICFVALSVVVGCNDHRMDLSEFKAFQQQFEQVPSDQPVESPADRKARIDQQFGPYRVGPSDVLLITVIGGEGVMEATTIRARVRRNGTIDVPLAGSIKVADMELEDVEEAIKKEYLAKFYQEATVHVELAETDSTNVLVTGAVTRPGLVSLRRNERNLLFAIVNAGGVSSIASGRVGLSRIRDPQQVASLDLTSAEDIAEALRLAPLEDGDMVTVETADPNTIFVGGLVNAPGPQAYPPGVRVTVLQTLAAAAGLRTDVLPREATLIRRMPNGQDVHVKLDLKRLMTGKDENIALAGGDILWVPHTPETRFQEWVSRNIYLRAGVSAGLSYNFIHTKDILKDDTSDTGLLIGVP